jgi:thiol-disulfide isomerase/thioredoxin
MRAGRMKLDIRRWEATVPMLRSTRMVAGAALAIAVLTGVTSCATASGGTNDEQTNYVDGHSVMTVYQPAHRKPAPAVTGTDLDGKPLDLASYAGKVVVLNFWASWCPPCRSEAPALQQVAADTRDLGVQFVGVDIREAGLSDGVQFVAAHKIDYPSFVDQSSRIALLFRASGVSTPPTTLVIDRHGRIAARGLSEMTYSQLLPVVQAVAKETS